MAALYTIGSAAEKRCTVSFITLLATEKNRLFIIGEKVFDKLKPQVGQLFLKKCFWLFLIEIAHTIKNLFFSRCRQSLARTSFIKPAFPTLCHQSHLPFACMVYLQNCKQHPARLKSSSIETTQALQGTDTKSKLIS